MSDDRVVKRSPSIAAVCIAALAMVAGPGTASTPSFPLSDDKLPIMTTADGVQFVRTPDGFFENLPDWPYEPKYVEIDGLRQAYVDAGPADADETILLLHGQPTWSYLYRKMIPVLADAGYRVIAMDHLGMGRSDKPIDVDYHSFLNHTHRLETFIEELELRNITPFVQDWGSLIGLYVVGLHPEWFGRVVVGNGSLPERPDGFVPFVLPEDAQAAQDQFYGNVSLVPAQQPRFYDDEGNRTFGATADRSYFSKWILFSRNDERLRASLLVEAMTYFPLTQAEIDAYDAPFPARIAMAAPRSFPGLANTMGGVTAKSWEGLRSFEKPFLTIWASNDPGQLGTREAQQMLIDNIPGAAGQPHTRLPQASHFLQDDQGEEIARRMIDFIESTPAQ
jgi:haloalkane dehalogenase